MYNKYFTLKLNLVINGRNALLNSAFTTTNKRALIAFIFYYRLAFVALSIVGIVFFSIKVWKYSLPTDQLKNCAIVFTGGSIIIGIFYSIINYEHNQNKFKHDVKISRETLTYNTSCKMYEESMMKHFRTARKFYNKNEILFSNGKGAEIDELFKTDEGADSRLALIIILNYLETISIGVEQGIMDEEFMKKFFKTIFRDNLIRYGTYIEHLRRTNSSSGVFKHFTNVADKWQNSDT